jgi:hypothetical protein
MIPFPISQNRRNRIHRVHQHLRCGHFLKRIYIPADGGRIIHALDSHVDPAYCIDPQPKKISAYLSYRFRRVRIALYRY